MLATLTRLGEPSGPQGLLAFHESPWLQDLWQSGAEFLPVLAAALGVLIVGYLIALLASALTTRALGHTEMDDRMASGLGQEGEPGASERAGGRIVFWAIMIFVLLGVIQVLGLGALGQPLTESLDAIGAFMPRLLAAAVLALVAWGLASILKRVSLAAMRATNLDERVGRPSDTDRIRLSESLSTGLFWLVILLFIPVILGALQLQALIDPINAMLTEFLGFIPNLVGAAIILLVGWFVATIVRNVATNFLAATAIDDIGNRWDTRDAMGQQTPSKLIGLLLYVLILIPVIVGALDALGIDAVTEPAQNALNTIVGTLPALAAAAGILLIAYLVARVVIGFVAGLLAGAGTDRLWGKIGLDQPAHGPSLSRAIALAAGAVIMVLASIEAAAVLGFERVADLFADLLVFAGRVALGLLILVVGLWLARVAAGAVRTTTLRNSDTVANITQAAIIVFAAGIALQEIGVAHDLVLLTFGLVLGAIAVAGAIAFGLGGRDVAEEELRTWRQQARGRGGEDFGG